MREKISVFILCMLVAGIPTIAQTWSLSARIISSADSIPVEFATVKLMQDDSVLVSATLTDENGVFRFDTPIISGMYLAISYCLIANVPFWVWHTLISNSNFASEIKYHNTYEEGNPHIDVTDSIVKFILTRHKGTHSR